MNDPEQNNSRPSQEDNWQVNGVQTARLKCSSLAKGNSCPVNQYSIVASRGDLARNNCTARETPAPCIVDKRNKATVNASTRAKHRDNLPLKGDIPCERLAKDAEGPATDLRKAQRPIRKSFSVPDYLREGKHVRVSPLQKIHSFSFFLFFNRVTSRVLEKFSFASRFFLSNTLTVMPLFLFLKRATLEY